MANKAKRFGAAFGAAAATLIGAVYLMSRAAEKNEYRLYPEHPENEGFGFDPLSMMTETKATPGDANAEPLPPAGPDAPQPKHLPPAGTVRPEPLNKGSVKDRQPAGPGMVLEDPANVFAHTKAGEPPKPAPAKGRTAVIGTASISDDPADDILRTVADVMEVPAENLVVLKADGNMPMVLEFRNPAIRTEINLKKVYFIAPDGSVSCPPDDETDNVVAFARSILAENEDLRKFLDRTL